MADYIDLSGNGKGVGGVDTDPNTYIYSVRIASGALGASSAIIGKVGIDQTTPGTTNLVSAGQNGAWNITNISGTISLPTGAATAAKQPALGTAGTASTDVITVQGIANSTPVSVRQTNGAVSSNSSTYYASGTAYTAYATPTDMLTLVGSATKTIIIISAIMQINTTAAGTQTLFFAKRSTANTGGTATNPTAIPLDSANSAATAVLSLYTAAPTPGTLVGNVGLANSTTTIVTSGGGVFTFSSTGIKDAPRLIGDFRQPVTLRGVAESFSMNWAGAALPTGFTATWQIEWIEF